MSALVPCTPAGVSHWTQRTTLDGVDFLLTFDWNQRNGQWSLTIADQDGADIVSGAVLVTRGHPLQGVIDTRRPAGDLAVVDATGANDVDPGFADLGSRFLLVYLTAAEIAA